MDTLLQKINFVNLSSTKNKGGGNLYLSKLHIKNYRSIKDLELEFRKGRNVIVGKNNSGKSNIIKAIDIVLGEKIPHYDGYENITKNDFFGGVDKSQTIIIKCILERDEGEELDFSDVKGYFYLYNEETPKNGTYIADLNYKVDLDNIEEIENLCSNEDYENKLKDSYNKWCVGNCRYSKIPYDVVFKNVDKFAFVFVAKYDEESDSIRKKLLFLFKEKDDNLWTVGFGGEKLRTYLLQSAIIPAFRDPKNQLRASSYTWFGKLLRKHWDEVREKNNEKLKELEDAFKNVENISNEIFKDMLKEIFDSGIRIAFPNAKLIIQYAPNPKDHDVYKHAKIYIDDGFKSELEEKGAGIQSAVIIGLFNYYVKNVAHKNCSSLLAIEEPELYLHPQGRRVISYKLDEFVRSGEEKKNHQVIITTHSVEFISNLDMETNLILVRKDKDDGTYAKNMEFNNPKDRQILIKKQNAEMFFADAVILVEGADKYILEKIAEEFGKECIIKDNNGEIRKLGENWLNDYNVSIINCSGKGNFYKYAKILNKLEIPYFIMADFDFLRRGLDDYLDKMGYDIEFINKVKSLANEMNNFDNRDSIKNKVSQFVQELIDEGILPELKSKKKGKIRYEIFNTIKKYSGANTKYIEQIEDDELKNEILRLLKELKNKNIFILTGELENFYKDTVNDIINNKMKKEEKVIKIIENSIDKPITEYVKHDEFYELLELFVEKCLNLEIFKTTLK